MANFRNSTRYLTLVVAVFFASEAFAQSPWDVIQDSYGLRVSPVSFNWQNNGQSQVQIFLKLQNVTNMNGSAGDNIYIAATYEGDTVVAEVTDGNGNSFNACSICRWVTGLPSGKNSSDWLILKPGGSVPISYTFKASGLGNNIGPPFSINASIRVFNPLRNKERDQSFMVYFEGLRKYP